MKGVICVFHVGPVADAFGQSFELPDVGEDRLRQSRVNSSMPTSSTIAFLPEMPSCFSTWTSTGSPLRVPAGAAGDEAALHRLVATEEVLVDARPDVVQSGLAVGRRRALVEDPRLGAFALLHGTREDVVRAPAGEFGLFESHESRFGVDGRNTSLLRCSHHRSERSNDVLNRPLRCLRDSRRRRRRVRRHEWRPRHRARGE